MSNQSTALIHLECTYKKLILKLSRIMWQRMHEDSAFNNTTVHTHKQAQRHRERERAFQSYVRTLRTYHRNVQETAEPRILSMAPAQVEEHHE